MYLIILIIITTVPTELNINTKKSPQARYSIARQQIYNDTINAKKPAKQNGPIANADKMSIIHRFNPSICMINAFL